MIEAIDRAELLAVVGEIENLKEEAIREVVARVPWQYLGDDDKVTIVEGLLGRRGLVRASLASYLQEEHATDV